MDELAALREDVALAGRIVHHEGLVNAFGHVSARIGGTDRFLFPPRRSPALIKADELLVLDVEGNQLEGAGRPNTEFWIHARIYNARPDVQAVCHVHSPMCVVVASLGETVRPLHNSTASYFPDGVPVFQRVGLIRSRELGDQVAACLGTHHGMLLRGHGANVVGDDVRRACLGALWLEEGASLQVSAMAAGKPTYYSQRELDLLHELLYTDRGPAERAWEYYKSRVGG